MGPPPGPSGLAQPSERLLQRPVVIYFYTNNDVCMNKEGFGNLSRLTTLGSSWGGLYYLEKEDHQAAYNSAAVPGFSRVKPQTSTIRPVSHLWVRCWNFPETI